MEEIIRGDKVKELRRQNYKGHLGKYQITNNYNRVVLESMMKTRS